MPRDMKLAQLITASTVLKYDVHQIRRDLELRLVPIKMRISQLQNSSSIGLPVSSCIYTVTTVHPNNQDVAVISSDDSLRIVDPSSSQLMVKTAIGKTHEGVTCLRSVDGAVVTAGRDAKIRIWDPKTGNLSTELNCPNLHGSPPKDTQGEANAPILSLACSNGKIAAGTQLAQSQATISVWYVSPRQAQGVRRS